jgi:hypothetical protein
LTKLQKVIPKGAQCKFSAQKSFQRECRAKYHRNRRRRSSKVVPKGMQNLYRQNRRQRSSKVVPKGMQSLDSKDVLKGMQSLVYSSVGEWVCVFGILIILHHIITSFCITLHHTTLTAQESSTKPIFGKCFVKLKMCSHEVSFGKYSFIRLAIRRDLFLYEA